MRIAVTGIASDDSEPYRREQLKSLLFSRFELQNRKVQFEAALGVRISEMLDNFINTNECTK